MATLQDLEKIYLEKKAIYDIEYNQNSAGRVALYAGGPFILPYNNQLVTRDVFQGWLNASDESLKLKKKAMDDASAAFETAKTAAADKADQDFKKNNPTAWANIQIEAAKTAAQGILAQKTTKYLIWGSVALVLIIGAIIIYKRKYAA